MKTKTVTLRGRPSPRQREFLSADARYIAYGGARGGGKSWALRRKCILLSLRYDGFRILLLRKTLGDLRENHLIPLLREIGGVATYKSEEKAVVFPNGSRIKMGYCEDDSDLNRYQGQEYDAICMDEATQFTELQFRCLCACLRGGRPGFPKRFYLTCNPGGVGHSWVKRLFIDRQYRKGEFADDYLFFPARVYDNEYLMKNNPQYLQQLESLPEDLKRAWLYGEWDVFAGQFFSEFRRSAHVERPFEIPDFFTRYFTCDYGLDMLAGLWIAVSPDGFAYVYREVYESGLIASEAASKIAACEQQGEEIALRIAPPDLWGRTKDSGKNIIEIFGREGLYFVKAENSRIQGWMALREWLRPFEEPGGKTARLKIFENCTNLIRTLPMLQYDRKILNDAATEPHEPTHAPDALRYWAALRPAAAEGGDDSVRMRKIEKTGGAGESLLREWRE